MAKRAGNSSERAVTSLPPIYLNTALIKDASSHDKLRLAAESGFDGLEMWVNDAAPHLLTAADRIAGRERFEWQAPTAAQDTSVLLAAMRREKLDFGGLLPGVDVMERWSERLDAGLIASLTQTFGVCAALGGRYVVLPTLARHGSLAGIARNLSELASLAGEYGIRLGLEPIGHTGIVNTVRDALIVLDAADSGGRAGIVLDAFHFFRSGQALAELAAVESDQIVAVQINDAIAMPVGDLAGNRHRDFPGSGMFDVRGFCEAVLNRGYDGGFTVEILNPVLWDRPDAENCRNAYVASAAVLSQAAGIAVEEAYAQPC